MPFVNKGAPPESLYYAFLYGKGRGEERVVPARRDAHT